MRYLILFIALILPATLSAQSIAATENELCSLYNKIELGQNENYEELEEYNATF